MLPTILVIDDSAVARELILDALRQADLEATLLSAPGGREALQLLDREPIDLVLCDLEMPGIDGLALLDRIGASERWREIPVIILTGHETCEEKIRGLERGACDYVTKPFHAGELVARVKVQLKIKSLQDRLRESNRRLEQLSRTDPLTGLANRRHFLEHLEETWDARRGPATPLALIMLDIDHFKRINDSYGHQAGDEVLCRVGTLLQEGCGGGTAARYGGEEFAVVLPGATLEQALQLAETLRTEVAALTFAPPLAALRLTASLGVAALPHPGVDTLNQLIREADDALYRAKHAGRNRVEAARP
ncbi:MAG: diguanylate cyclase [Deltaproteobacteria bacterium]|nr:MAG: diguanylate cyclase [Deltaproteobacteria bacterium]